MLVRANKKNLQAHAADLLGGNDNDGARAALLAECAGGFKRSTTPGGHPFGHISHDRAAHLGRINAITGGCGVEGMRLDRYGDDRSGDCSMRDVRHDIQYVNAGESYGITILYYNGRLMIGDWGSIVERCPARRGGRS